MLCAWLGWACTGLGNCMLQCCGQALGSALARPWEWLFGRPWGGVVESLGHGSGLLGQGTAMQLAWLCKGLARALGMPWAVLWTGLGHDPGKALGMALGRPWAMLWKDWGQSLGIDLKGGRALGSWWQGLGKPLARLGAGLGQGSWDALGQCFGHAFWHGTGQALGKALEGLELGLGDGLGQAFGKALECIDGGLGNACPCGVMPQGHD